MNICYKRHIKAFILGSCYPIMIFPAAIFGQMHRINPIDLSAQTDVMRPLIFENMGIVNPFYYGLWNMLFLLTSSMVGAHSFSRNLRYYVGGFILGATFAGYGVIVHEMPTELFGLPERMQYMVPLISGLFYGLVYVFVQKNLNIFFDLEPKEFVPAAPNEGASFSSWLMRVGIAGFFFFMIPLVGMAVWMNFFPWQPIV